MPLPPSLIQYINSVFEAAPTLEDVGRMVKRAVSEWGADPEEVVDYVYERTWDSPVLREGLRLALDRSLNEGDELDMPAQMDARIRLQLFGQGNNPQSTSTALQMSSSLDLPPLERFSSIPIETNWQKVGPFLSPVSWRVQACEQAWAVADRTEDLCHARRFLLQWRAVEKLMHFDMLALDELEALAQEDGLDASVVAQLRICVNRMRTIADGIDRILQGASAPVG